MDKKHRFFEVFWCKNTNFTLVSCDLLCPAMAQVFYSATVGYFFLGFLGERISDGIM